MSTDSERQENKTVSAEALFNEPSSGGAENVWRNDEIAQLSEEVEGLKNKLGEVVFIAIFFNVIVIDMFLFQFYDVWTSPLVIGILQIIVLIVLARICKVNDINVIMNIILDGVDRLKGR